MFKAYLAVLSYLLIGSSGAALADALHDCARLSGDAAIQACDQAIRQNPRDAVSYANRGVEYRNKGDLDRALADFTKAIAIDPKFAVAYNNRGLVFREKGDIDRALADYSKAIEVDPKHVLAYYNRCWLRATENRDLPLALADCDAAIRLAPSDPGYLGSRGFVYLRQNRLDEAIADYDAALKLDPRMAASLYGRGLAKQKKGDQAGGDADIAAAKAINATIADGFAKYGVN